MNWTKIEWTDCSLNPVVGCPHGCPFCFAKKQSRRIPMMMAGDWLKKRGILYKHLPKEERLGIYRGTPVCCEHCFNFEPHFHPDALKKITPDQKPKKIFIDSMWDWNAEGVHSEWLNAILKDKVSFFLQGH